MRSTIPSSTPSLLDSVRIRTAKPRPLSYSLARLGSAATVAAVLGMAAASNAATFYWDPTLDGDGAFGGSGTWDTVAANHSWDPTGTDPVTADNVAWPNLANSIAVFQGGAGTVTISNAGAGVVANGLTFNTTGYNIVSSIPTDVLTLAGATPTIGVTTLGDSANIDSIVAGTNGLRKTGAGTLVLTGANTFTGGIQVASGTLSATVTSGPSPINSLSNNAITLSAGSTLDLTPTADTSLAGISGRVFNTGTALGDTSRIDFTQTAGGNGALTATRTDTQLNNTGTVAGGTNVNLGIQWLGKLNITNAGSYSFGTNSDDGSRVYIDGVLVVNNDGPKGVGTVNTGPGFILSTGLHDIRVDYVNGTGGAGLLVGYRGPDQAAFGAIPTGVLFQAESNTAAASSNAIVIGTGIGDDVTVSGGGTSTVNLNGSAFTQVQFGVLGIESGSTLQVTGLAGKTVRFAGTALLGSGAGSVTLGGAPNIALDGVVSDSGNAMTINKIGTGRLIFGQTATANALGATTTINVQGGAIGVVGSTAGGANNPIGSASVTLSGAGTGLVIDTKGATTSGVGNTYSNNITVTGLGTTIQDVVNAATTTLSGNLAVNSGASVTLDAIAGGQPATDPGASLVISGVVTGSGGITLTSTRLGDFATSAPGTVAFTGNTSAFTGSLAVTSGFSFNRTFGQFGSASGIDLAGGATMNYLFDGNGSGTPGSSPIVSQNLASENVVFGDNVTVSGAGTATIVANRLGTTFAPLFPAAVNKTARLGTLSIGTQTLSITNTNGYGVDFTGATTLTGASTFSVANTNISTVVPGLTLSGAVNGAFGFTKTGAGTLLLSNAANGFTGDINVTGGALAFSNDLALGAAANQVILNGAGATLRAVGTTPIVSGRTIQINSAANSFIEVAEGQSLTLSSAFGGAAAGAFTKADNGILILNAASANTGASVVNAGVVRLTNAASLGATAATIGVSGVFGAAVQLANNITVPNQIIINNSAANVATGGVNFGGQLENFSGTNSVTGVVTLNADAAIGSTSGVLNINGGINNPTATTRAIYLTGAGTINVNSSITSATATANQYFALQKYGSGTLNFTTAQPFTLATGSTQNLTFLDGTTNFSGNGSLIGTPTIAATINPNAILNLDNTSTNVADRLGVTRPVTVSGGTLNFTANAAGTATTMGVLTTNFAAKISSNQAGAGAATLTFASAAFGANSASIEFTGTNLGTANNRIIITAAPTTVPATTGILARASINSGSGLDFVSYNNTGAVANTNGIQAFATYNVANSIDAAAATDTLNVTAAPAFANGSKTINALKLTGTGINVASTGTIGNTPTTLTLTAAAILATGGLNTISAPALAFGTGELWAHVDAGATLTLSSALGGGTTGMTKADGGTLILAPVASAIAGITPSNISGTFGLNGGTLQIGSNNAYTPNQFLRVGPAATLDLNGKLQAFRGILSDTSLEATTLGQHGTITSSSGTGNLVTNLDNSARSWSGQITGTVNLLRSGENTWSVFSNNTYTGNTLLNGGTTTLRDGGRLSGSNTIDINYGVLTLDNNAGFRDESNRIKDTATVTLRGGVINLTGRAQTASSETIGSLVLAEGNSNITVAGGGTNVNSADLTFGSLVQQNSATINVNTLNGQIGSAGRLLFTTAPTLTNGILPYFVSGGNDLVTYIPGLGIAAINAAGGRGYDALAFPATFTNGSQNIKLSNATFTIPDAPTNSYELNAISWTANTAGQSINFADAADTLNLTSGLLNKSGNQLGNIGATLDSGRLTAGGNVAATGQTQNLYITMNTGGNALTVNSRIVDNTNSDRVRLVFTAYNGATLTLANNLNSYSGGTVVNGGVSFTGVLNVGSTGIIPAGGLTINRATVAQAVGGVINSANVPVLNGGATLTLSGDNTLAGVVFNNAGGSVNGNTLNTTSNGILGTLTIGASGLSATSSNVSSTSQIVGRVDFGTTAKTVAIDPIFFNGVDINPTQGTLALQGIVGSAGGINKTGLGSLTLNAQQTYTGPTNVIQGGIITNFGGVALTGPVAGSRFSAYTFAAGTTLNLINDAMIGSLAGAGTVTNSSTTDRTFGVGFDNTDTTFSGQFLRFSDARLTPFSVNKFGSGTLTLTGVSNDNNSLNVRVGGVTFAGTGRGTFGTDSIFPTGTLTLDNRNAQGGNVNNRLGGFTNVGTLNPAGGSFVAFGNETAANPTSEVIGTVTFGSGGSTVTLNADANNPLTLTVGTTFSGVQGGASALIRGTGFGSAPGNGVGTISLGALGLNAPTGAGNGANGTQTMAIRPDLIGGTTATSLGTAFITKDTVGNYLRPLDASELASTLTTATTASTNVALSANTLITGSAPGATLSSQNLAFSLTLNAGGGVSIGSSPAFGRYTGGAALVQTKIGSGGFLALAGNTGITSGQIDTSNNTAFNFHTPGAATVLTLDGYLGTTNGGLVKSDDGTVNLNTASYYTGTTTVNAGTLAITSGVNNSIQAVTTAGAPTLSALRVNAGVFELNGTSQMVGTLDSNSFATGGSVRNSAVGTPATLSTVTGAAASFGGTIDGNLNFVKSGNNELILTNPSSYSGTTTVRGNNLRIRDAGTLASTGFDINFGGLILDNSALTPLAALNPVRISASSTVNLRGGSLTLLAGGSTDTAATLNAVNVLQGHNAIVSGSTAGTTAGSTAVINIGNLVTAGSDVTATFVGGTSGFFSNLPGFGSGQVYIGSINGTPIPANITNKILGGWALANNGEFLTYIQPGTAGNTAGINYGVTTLNSNFAGIGQTSYDFNQATLPVSTPTANVRLSTAGTAAVPAAGATYNVLAVRAAVTAITFTNAADRLNLGAGGLALTNGGTVVGTTALPGVITSGGTATGTSPLYLYSAGANNTINSVIANNGTAGALTRFVAVPIANSLILANVNTYTGGTVVNGAGGTLNLNGATPSAAQILAGQAEIPAGGLTLNNALVTMTTNAGQIDPTNAVTLNGGSSLTLFGSNTLSNVTFNNIGGFAAANPTVATATALALSAPDAITVTNDNIGSVPSISGTALTFSNASPVISTTGAAPTSLSITAPITSAGASGISKQGDGSVFLSGVSTFTTGFKLDAGTLIVGVSSTGTLPAITNGPVGTGTLSIGTGTTLHSTNNFTVGNPTSVAGDFTLGGTTTIGTNQTLTLSGAMTLAAGAHTITVSSPFITDTISGAVSGGTNLTKAGPGTLTLSAANSYGGTTNVAAGVLKLGNAGAIPNTSSPTINAGAVLDINGIANVSLRGLTGTGLITNSGAAQNVYVGGLTTTDSASAFDSTFDGVITNGANAFNLVKTGVGNLTLTGANSFTGSVNLNPSATTSGGRVTITNSLALGGGNKTVTNITNVAGSLQGSLHLDGSTANGPVVLGSNISFNTSQGSLTSPAIVNDAGNNVINGNFTLNSGGGSTSIFSNGGSLTLNGTFTPNTNGRFLLLGGSAAGQINGVIADQTVPNFLSVTKSGSGKWTIANNTNTYTGPTLVSDGTLIVNGSISGSATTVSGANSVLGGSGTVKSVTVNTGGTVAPGNGPGVLTVASTFSLDSTSHLAIEINSPGVAGLTYDQVSVGGAINLGNASLDLAIGFAGGNTQDIFTIILNNSGSAVTGTFAGLANASLVVAPNGQMYTISYFDDPNTPAFETSGGNSVALLAVPEPNAFAMLLGSVGVALGLNRFRRRAV